MASLIFLMGHLWREILSLLAWQDPKNRRYRRQTYQGPFLTSLRRADWLILVSHGSPKEEPDRLLPYKNSPINSQIPRTSHLRCRRRSWPRSMQRRWPERSNNGRPKQPAGVACLRHTFVPMLTGVLHLPPKASYSPTSHYFPTVPVPVQPNNSASFKVSKLGQ